ncbi:GNAT family N-acetyltransferase [Pseudomonas peli]|uniref:GNAT family N-acetyltransferase n=1 Tax=Pseudomonas peli TaxID=592361 RepID=UPI0024ADA027|nr:GNAT family N-acetyltransferase [Pseudomonas peli]
MGNVLVAEEQHEIVGNGAIDPASSEVEGIFVIPSCADRGIGRVLLGALESQALDHKLVTLHLSASLNAVSFYRRAGYVFSTRGAFPLNESLALEFENMEKRLGAAV